VCCDQPISSHIPIESDGQIFMICPSKFEPLDALAVSGLLQPASAKAQRIAPIEGRKKEETPKMSTADAIMNKLNEIDTKLSAVLAKLEQTGSRRSGGGSGKADSFADRAKLQDVQTRSFLISRVYEDAVGNGTSYKIQCEGGPKVATYVKAAGEFAKAAKGSGRSVSLTYGKNQKGYLDLVEMPVWADEAAVDNDLGF
jgi:hypothetical protein